MIMGNAITLPACRILYIPKNYNLLTQNTPPEISRQLRKCYSTVLAYKADR